MDIDLAIEEQFFLLSSISLDLHLKIDFLNPFPLPFFKEEKDVAYPDADAANALAGSVKIAEDSYKECYPFSRRKNDVAYLDADAANVLAGSVEIAEDSSEDSYMENTPSKTTRRKSPGSKGQNVTGDVAAFKTPTSEIVQDKDFDVKTASQKGSISLNSGLPKNIGYKVFEEVHPEAKSAKEIVMEVKDKQEKDKIEIKQDKNEKRGEAGGSQKQLQ
nr:hypothetical protein [Tanacetum cinerariifolium]